MSSVTYTVFLLVTIIVTNPSSADKFKVHQANYDCLSDIYASKIYNLDVPPVVRNGTGPIDLSCIYNITENENGLVIKWYHNTEQIYQWIPPMPPQDIGVINGFTEYPEENLRESNSRSIIYLKMATIEMSGEYTCMVSTFQEEDTKRTKMIVYVPETNAIIHVSSFNESHLNLTCVTNGAQPRPTLKIYVEGIEANNYHDKNVKTIGHGNAYSVKRTAIMKNALEPLLLECEISIPHTDYKRRERIVYYPSPNRSNGPVNESPDQKMNYTCAMLFLVVCALWTFGETLSCDQCGKECADICGTRQFRACCFNNMKKRQFDFGLKLWMIPRRYMIWLHPDFDIH